MVSRLSSRFDTPSLRAVSPQKASDSADRSEPTTKPRRNFSAVMSAWFAPQPATQTRGHLGTTPPSQQPMLWLSMSASK